MVLCVDVAQANLWTTDEVITRWHLLFKGMLITQQ